MGSLRLALAGLWWRRATSATLLVVALITTAAAAAAPSYAASARDAVLQSALLRAPTDERGTGISATASLVGTPSTTPLESTVREAFRGGAAAAYPHLVMQLSVQQRAVDAAAVGAPNVSLISRDGLCDRLRITAGRCVRDGDRTGVVVEASTARAEGLRVGSAVQVEGIGLRGDPTRLTVRGVAVRAEPSAAYWSGADDGDGPYSTQVWAPRSYFQALRAQPGDLVQATADLALDPARVHAASIDALTRAVGDAVRAVRTSAGAPTVTTGIETVVDGGLASGTLVLVPILVNVAALLALGWFLLHTLLGGAAEARGAEVALGKVRGLTGGRTLLLTLLEPMLLLAAAVPLGVLVAVALEHAVVPGLLGADVDVAVGWTSWAAAAGAAAGGVLAAAAASTAVLRRPVLEQWRRSGRTASRRGPVVEVVLVVLAVAGIVQLRLSGALTAGTANGVALLAPMLLIVAGAVAASRLLALLARLGFGATRASGAIAAFVGLRQLVRRPAGRRTFGVVAVAVALAVFAVSSTVVTAENRDARALTDVGAPTVLHVDADPRTAQRIRSIDPDGRSVAAVAQVPIDVSTGSDVFGGATNAASSPQLLVVDPASFASVATWRQDFGSAPLADLVRPLAAAAPVSPEVEGTTLRLDVTGSASSAVLLQADLVDARGVLVTAVLGALRDGDRTYSAAVPACADGCTLRRVYVTRAVASDALLTARFTLRGASGVSDGVATAARPAVTAVGWAALNPLPPGQATPAERLDTTAGGVQVAIVVSGQPSPDSPGFGVAAGVPAAVPALVTGSVRGDAPTLTAVTPDRAAVDLRPSGRVSVLPRVGDAGAVVARDWLAAASPDGTALQQADQIWIGAGAPAGTIERLRAAGVRILSIDRAAERAQVLAAEGPAFSAALVLGSGATAVLLAGFAVVLGLVLLARRRVFELSAMRALGIRRRSLFGAVLVEQAVLVVTAAATGLVLALVGVQLALPAVPAYADAPTYPPFVVDQPVGLLLAVCAGVVLLLLLAVAVVAAVLVRSASIVRLREAEQ